MLHQASRQSQPSPAKKPGACMSCLCASALKPVVDCQRDRYPRDSRGDSPAYSRPANQIDNRTAGEQATGKDKPVTSSTRARINPAGKGSRACREGKPGPDPAIAQKVRSVCSAARSKYLIYKQSASGSAPFDILVIMRNALDYAHTINQLQIEPCIMYWYAPQHVRCNKGAPVPSVEYGHRHQVGPGTGQPGQSIEGISLYQSGSYAVRPCSAQCARHAGRPAIRRTPVGLLKFPFPSTGRRAGWAPQ